MEICDFFILVVLLLTVISILAFYFNDEKNHVENYQKTSEEMKNLNSDNIPYEDNSFLWNVI